MSFDKDMVRVYNYNPFTVGFTVNGHNVLLKGTLDHMFPSMETMTLRELEYLNAHTPAVRNGTVEFHEDEREEIYAALRISNWRDTCIFDREIDEMLTQPTFDNMQKVLAVKDLPTIERIFAHMNRLIHSNGADVSSRVQAVVTNRRKEIRDGVPTSRIQLTKKDIPVSESVSEAMIEKLVEAKLAEMVAKAAEPVVPADADETEDSVVVPEEPAEAPAPVKAKPRAKTKAK